jgi:hypothetical protein
MTNQFINQSADDWAKCNLVRAIEIKPLHNSVFSQILVALAIGFLSLIFLGIPAALLYGSAVRYRAEGWSGQVSRGFMMGSIFLVAFVALASFLIFYVRRLRRNQIKFLTSEGIFTRSKNFNWKKLHHLKFIPVQTEVRGGIFLRLTTRAMYRGVQKIKIEMVFADETATAIIPPLIADQREILELLDTIPVECRRD